MTIETIQTRVDYSGDGASTEFAVPFPFFGAAELLVIERDTATGNETEQVLGVDYTVSGGSGDVGTVTASTAPAAGTAWFIVRDTNRTQLVDLTEHDAFPAEVVEKEVADRLQAQIQELELVLQRTLRVTATDALPNLLPNSVERANGVQAYDADGQPIILSIDEMGGIVGPAGPAGPPGVGAPIGAIMSWGGATAPPGWLLADGSAVSRTTYAALFAIYGTTYGSGDGATTFNLPDVKGRIQLGKDDMGGAAAGRVTVIGSGITATLLGATGGDQRTQAHSHLITDPGHTHALSITSGGAHSHTTTMRASNNDISAGTSGAELSADGAGAIYSTDAAGTHTHTGSALSNTTGITVQTGGSGSGQNMPPVIVFNVIICATSIASEGGATLFTELLDVPGDYTGQAGHVPVVNEAEDGLEFQAIADVPGFGAAVDARIAATPIPFRWPVAVGDETTAITAGATKIKFRWPFHNTTLTGITVSLNEASSSGVPTFDINVGGSTILSTKLTVDAGETTSVSAATPPVLSASTIAYDAEVTVDVDVSGTGAKGPKLNFLGTWHE